MAINTYFISQENMWTICIHMWMLGTDHKRSDCEKGMSHCALENIETEVSYFLMHQLPWLSSAASDFISFRCTTINLGDLSAGINTMEAFAQHSCCGQHKDSMGHISGPKIWTILWKSGERAGGQSLVALKKNTRLASSTVCWESLWGHCAQAPSPPGWELCSPSCSQKPVPWARNSIHHFSLLHMGWPLGCCQRQAEPLCLTQMSLGNLAFLVKTHFVRVLLSSCKHSHGAAKETIL